MARKVANYAKWTQKQWQDYRQKQQGLGGSDIAAALGINKYKSARRLWSELTGAVQREDISDKPAVRMGNKLEPIVAELFAEETGYKVRKNNWILQHDTIDYLYANIDREVILPDGSRAVLECKTSNYNMRKYWEGDSVPKEYMAQVQYYLMITGYQKAFMAVLIGGVDFDYWIIERNEAIIADIEKQAADFWQHVLDGTMPAIDGSEDAAKLLLESYTEADKDLIVDLPDADAEKVEMREILQQQKKELEAQINAIDNYFKDKIGQAGATAAKAGSYYVNWNIQNRRSFDEKALASKYPKLFREWTAAKDQFTTFKPTRAIRY
jgi:putative phage-type endonuclease